MLLKDQTQAIAHNDWMTSDSCDGNFWKQRFGKMIGLYPEGRLPGKMIAFCDYPS